MTILISFFPPNFSKKRKKCFINFFIDFVFSITILFTAIPLHYHIILHIPHIPIQIQRIPTSIFCIPTPIPNISTPIFCIPISILHILLIPFPFSILAFANSLLWTLFLNYK